MYKGFLILFLILLCIGCNTVDRGEEETNTGINITVSDVNGSSLRDVNVYVKYNFTSVYPKRLGIDSVVYGEFTYVITPLRKVELQWSTTAEVSNYMFYIERREQSSANWIKLDSIRGKGTTPVNAENFYSYVDPADLNGIYYYRLKQVDTDATVHYFKEIEVIIITIPGDYQLLTNSPNPFEDITNFRFLLPERSNVKLTIEEYDSGSDLVTVVDDTVEAGTHSIEFDSRGKLANGVYNMSFEASSRISSKNFSRKEAVCKNNISDESLKDDIPDYKTDRDGKAEIKYDELHLGAEIDFVESGTNLNGKNYISNTVDLLFVKSGYKNFNETVVIDSLEAKILDIQLETE